LGAVIAIVSGLSTLGGLPILWVAAFLGSAATLALVLAVAAEGKRVSSFTLLLSGVTVNGIVMSVIMLLHNLSSVQQSFAIVHWLMGNIDPVDAPTLIWLSLVILPICFGLFQDVAHDGQLLLLFLRHVRRPIVRIADRANQETIRRYAQSYPNARFILAHAARGFNPHHTIEGITALAGLHNIWCDTSAVTDGGAIEAIIRTLGVQRLLYGSDFPVSHLRGRCVAMGDSFISLTEDNVDFDQPIGPVVPTLVGLEALRTLKLACLNTNQSDAQVERIFFGNAAELFGLQT
jgi:hypothetical protein